MRHVSGKGEDVAGREVMTLARDEDRDAAVEAGEIFAGAGRCGVPAMRRRAQNPSAPASRRARARAPAARTVMPRPRDCFGMSASAQRRVLARGPASNSSIGTCQARATLTRTAREVPLAGFEIGDRRAGQFGRLGQSPLRQGPHMPEGREIAGEVTRHVVDSSILSTFRQSAGRRGRRVAPMSSSPCQQGDIA